MYLIGLGVFESRAPRKIFGPKRDEVTGEWRRLHNEELYDLYSSPNITRAIKSSVMGREGGTYVGQERCIQGFGGRPEGKRPLGRPGRRWEDDIEIGLQEME
jgi:hypothetical protein